MLRGIAGIKVTCSVATLRDDPVQTGSLPATVPRNQEILWDE